MSLDSESTHVPARTMRRKVAWMGFLLPLLIGLGSVAAFYRPNMSQAKVEDLLLPVFFTIAVSVVIGIFLSLMSIERTRAAVSAALWAALVFWFGHVVHIFESPAEEVAIHRQIQILLFAFLACGYTSVFIFRLRVQMEQAVRGILVFCVILFAFNGFSIIGYHLRQSTVEIVDRSPESQTESPQNISVRPANTPDIYLIILDEFASISTIDELFSYDASALHHQLRKCGFVVQDDAQAISDNTMEVMASILNGEIIKSPDFNLLFSRIRNNAVVRSLKDAGYSTYYYPSYPYYDKVSPMVGADLNADPYEIAGVQAATDKFEYEFLRTTAARPFITSALRSQFGGSVNGLYTKHMVDVLKALPSDPKPTFVYTHITCPHPPYVFDENGRNLGIISHDGDRYYLGQYKYVSRMIAELVCDIVSGSPEPPVVIVQSDHGVRGKKHASVGNQPKHWQSIFRAYYMPTLSPDSRVPDLGPTEDFRYVFESLLGRPLPGLPSK